MPTNREGRISLNNGYKLWYRIVGDGPATPLLLHGGPGAGHDYLEPLEALSADRPVVFYDQLGCGRSDQPDDPSLWTIDRFCSEVDEVRAALGLTTCHVPGQSWGGWLGIEWLLRRPQGVNSVVLASTSSSTAQCVAEARKLIGQMPAAEQEALRVHEAAGAYDIRTTRPRWAPSAAAMSAACPSGRTASTARWPTSTATPSISR